ncbi:hypothetical protein PAXRUDRAFT_662261 [Paxillus rubicundulus Ve08.2h10]|uniref:Uncharacterized protein n=1 Tax=Paxillus rubicundulus Ve08.2h10 TaxID=930991 RepID=A0A0D0D2X6_9AGAM|nr:hypothetical protein PAXRUDRAFT_662261 [Paxillus rubicundulus Ve08.2h10]
MIARHHEDRNPHQPNKHQGRTKLPWHSTRVYVWVSFVVRRRWRFVRRRSWGNAAIHVVGVDVAFSSSAEPGECG